MTELTAVAYLISGVCFIMALRGLSSPDSARAGNVYAMVGMLLAIVTTLFSPLVQDYTYIIVALLLGAAIGTVIALKIVMTALPQLIAAFHSLVGMAAVLVAFGAFFSPQSYDIGTVGAINLASLIEMSLGVVIGAITFSGSVIAFAKLQGIMKSKPITFKGQHFLNAVLALSLVGLVIFFTQNQSPEVFYILTAIAFVFGFLLIIPVGGADMPVIVSMLNSYSGWAAVGIGFTLHNSLLIITGALVGASGAILSYIMCKAMNRSIFNVILGGLGAESSVGASDDEGKTVKSGSPDDAGFIMKNSSKVIIVPGYGMAVAGAGHALKEMADKLKEEGVEVKYAIHPVAGRMPGHMNVLLAEANVPYEEVFELEDINSEFASTDVVYVIGANDVTNPSAKTDPTSPIYGMPILDVEKAKTIFFVKRSMSSGYAGVDNPLFFAPNTMMLFGDAKKVTEEIIKAL